MNADSSTSSPALPVKPATIDAIGANISITSTSRASAGSGSSVQQATATTVEKA